jgi:dienelactone hydrolase
MTMTMRCPCSLQPPLTVTMEQQRIRQLEAKTLPESAKNHSQRRGTFQAPFQLASFPLFLVLWVVLSSSSFSMLSTFCPAHSFILPSNPTFGVHRSRHSRSNRNSRQLYAATEEDDDEEELPPPVELPYDNPAPLSSDELERLTVPQLKQQLRLRGLKVSGIKLELMNRLLQASGAYVDTGADDDDDEEEEENYYDDDDENYDPSASDDGYANEVEAELLQPGAANKARQFAKERGKELIDVTAYVDDDDKGKNVRSSGSKQKKKAAQDNKEINASTEPEVWGADARVVDDYEGRRVVVDSLSSSVVEFTGSNQTAVQALVVASRDAWGPFLAGGRANNATKTPAEIRLRDIQTKRERAARQPVRFEDSVGLDVDDENRIYTDVILDREFSDWGKYTLTGEQLSASEVQGVLLLSDVYGAFTDDTRALAEKIAFECQPVVVMVPDVFRGEPWNENPLTPGLNDIGQDYEQWRMTHDDLRVSVDIRAAANCLRERFGVSSVVVWGTCYGGGKALEAAAGILPNDNIHDVDGSVGPPLVDPIACVSWYPTRYNVADLFGKHHMGADKDIYGNKRSVAVMAIFAGEDTIPGATKEDAAELKALLEEDDRIKDLLVKVFPGQEHGFAHIGLSRPEETDAFERFVDEEFGGSGRVGLGEGDAEVACLLSTAFMETYSRVFLPTVGPPIGRNDQESQWSDLEMKSLEEANARDVREEIEESLDSFVEEPLGGTRVDPTDDTQENELAEILRSMEDANAKKGPYAIEEDDDLVTIYAKLKASDENFQIF